MASKSSLPASLLRTYTSLFGARTSQLRFHASKLLGVRSQDAWRKHMDGVASGIQNLTTSGSAMRVQAIPVHSQPSPGFTQRRWNSTSSSAPPRSKIYTFTDILSTLETPSSSRLLIDVREPHEFEANTIPTSINLPITSQPDALLLSEEEFNDKFGFAKPPVGKEVVFFCKAGVRSRAAAGLARQAGYQNVGEYPGSWRDWETRGGPGTKSPPKAEGAGEPQVPVTETRPVRGKGDSGEEDLGGQGVPYVKGPEIQ